MPDTALTTRISPETFRRLKLLALWTDRSIKELVEEALVEYLAASETAAEGATEDA